MGAATLAAVAVVVSACSTNGAPRHLDVAAPRVPGAEFVGNESCLRCHEEVHRDFQTSPHGRIHLTEARFVGGTGCESCHGPGGLHVAAGGGRGVHIVNPGRDPASCLVCHAQTHAEFQLPHRHPVLEGQLNCVDCHDPHGRDILRPAGGLGIARQDESCVTCHQEQSRHHVYPHEALREGCVTCHTPHGSVNDKLLIAPDNNLCLRCHAQIAAPGAAGGDLFIGAQRHSVYLTRGTCWTAGCHTAVHGSNIDRLMRY